MTRRRSLVLCLLAMLPALATTLPIPVRADDDSKKEKVSVRCGKGKTINDVLAERRGPLTIEVVGTCFEPVTVASNDVTLKAGTPGSGIQGTDSTVDTLTVTADRFVLNGLHVTGGRNAIVVTGSQAQLRNCRVASAVGAGIAAGIGILFFQGASGTVDTCEVTGNGADGMMIDGALAVITNSRFTANGRNGVFVFGGSTARIGLTNSFAVAPNVISDNRGNGLHITQNSMALVYGNTISGNGVNPASPVGRFGVILFQSRADLIGSNTITGNFGTGVALFSSTAFIGDPGFGLAFTNTIRGNSTAAPTAGVSAGIASSVVIRAATIDANNGAGVALSERSTAVLFSANVTNNTANGVQLIQGSGVVFRPNAPQSVISGNTGFDLKCFDTESSITTGYAGSPTIDGCTAF